MGTLWVIFHTFCCGLLIFFFQKINIIQRILSVTLSVPNSSDSDQDGRSVGPDLAPNCLYQRRTKVAARHTIRVPNSADPDQD